jgi:DNA-binding NarL/FixJ family response regulator
MQNQHLRVLIVSRLGAHQKAIQAICASLPQFTRIETATSARQALEQIKNDRPDLLITGANLTEERVCELLSQVKEMPKPPYCIVLTLSEFSPCSDQKPGPDQVISTKSFGTRLPEILNEVYAY